MANMLRGQLNENNCMELVDKLLGAVKDGKKSFTLMINSSGGSVLSSTAVIETMKELRPVLEITTVGIGQVASSAAKIFLCGEKRFLVPDTLFCLHYTRNPSNARGTVAEQIADLEVSKAINDRFLRTVFERTEISPELLDEKCKGGYGDWILTPEEILKYKVAEYTEPGWHKLFV